MERTTREQAEMYNRHASATAETVLAHLPIATGMTIADIGAGGGYYTLKFAGLVGADGRVYAVDKDLGMLDFIRTAAIREGYANIETVQATDDGKGLSLPSCDLIFLRNVFHHLERPECLLPALRPLLKPDGTLAVIDWVPGVAGPNGPRHGSREEDILSLLAEAGYRRMKCVTALSEQSFNLFGLSVGRN